MERSLNVIDTKDAQEKVNDVEIVGNPDMVKLLCKASSKSQDWMKSCKAMEIKGVGCIVQVTTQQGNNVAEALTFVPKVSIITNASGHSSLE